MGVFASGIRNDASGTVLPPIFVVQGVIMPNEDNDGTLAVGTRGYGSEHAWKAKREISSAEASPIHSDGVNPAPGAKPLRESELVMEALSFEYARTRDPQMRERLILHHQRLVHYVASRFLGSGETLDDLVQVGTIGLINALDRYDPAQKVKFSTYAMPTIVGEIKRHFRDKTWQVKVPRWLQELSLNAKKAQQTLSTRYGRPPTVREVAEFLGATEDDALEALEIGQIASAVSLDTRLDPHAGGDSATLMDVIGQLDNALRDIEAYADLRRALDCLELRESQVIHLRFFDELSQAKIARKLNISQMHVSRLQQRALTRLHEILADEAVHSELPSPQRAPRSRPRTSRRTGVA
jgi:RNA polymerase sigma-B factor